jgi:hypothetical protein
MAYYDWPESMRPLHGPMRLDQLSEVLRHAVNRAHKEASTTGLKDTAGGFYSAWLWCQLGLKGEPRGALNWLGQQRLFEIQECTALDDAATALIPI